MDTGLWIIENKDGWLLTNKGDKWINKNFNYDMVKEYELVCDEKQVLSLIKKAKEDNWDLQPIFKQQVYINANSVIVRVGNKISI